MILNTSESKWIRFELAPKQNPKTKVWSVLTKEGRNHIGTVKWFGRWRMYAFFPDVDTVHEQTCLRDIAAFCERQTAEQRKAAHAT